MTLPFNFSWQSLNDCYIRESGMESKPFLSKEFAWGNWSKHGFTENDLVQVLRYLRKQVNRGERKPASMLFRNLIEYPESFECELCLSKEDLLRQKHVPDPRQSILRAAGRPEQPQNTARPIKEVFNLKAFEKFKAEMEAQGLL